MSFLSDASYREFLEKHILALSDATAREHVARRFEFWRQQYCGRRAVERAVELLTSEKDRPNMLYLRSEVDVGLLRLMAQRHRFDARLFRGFLVTDSLWAGLKPEWFSPFPVCRVSDWQDRENTAVFTLSDASPLRDNGRDKGNDYLDCFIDESRLSISAETRRKLAKRRTVLYVDYRKVQTLAALSDEIRKDSDFATVLLVNSAEGSSGQEFDVVIEQPSYYLWPLVFRSLSPDLFHVNVGWGTQGLPFAPFLPDETIIDFYDLLTFVRDDALDGHHSEPLALTRSSEKALFGRFKRFIHRCSDTVSDSLNETYPGREIVSVTEYLREPLYVPEPARRDGIIRLVYGGLLVQEGAGPENPHYKNFLQMVKYYGRDNLHLYLYPSPYLYGFDAPKGAEELIRRMELTNVHTCMPLAENDFVREITRYDFGMCMPTPEDVRPTSYGYILPSKFITYLRAGLPIVVPEDQWFIADLVRDNGIGVVYGYGDEERMPELLNSQDIDQLKENVVRFREQFRIERAAEKVLRLYDDAAKPSGLSLRAARSAAVSRRKRVVTARRMETPACKPRTDTPACSWPRLIEKLERLGFLNAREYQEILDHEITHVLSGKERQYVAEKFQNWFGAYRNWRLLSRLFEIVAETKGTPYRLYLDDPAQLDLLTPFLNALDEAGVSRPAGFIVADGLEGQKDRLSPCSVCGVRDSVPADCVVIGFSGAQFPGNGRDVRLNDYLDRFIDARRFQGVREMMRSRGESRVVLYPLYREIHTIPMMARCIRQKDEAIRCVALSPGQLIDSNFDAALAEPFLYLWPLVFRIVDPALVHLNVGWGIQALPLSPFVPDRERTVIDFYEVLSFLPDSYFEKTHSSAEQVRFAEEHFLRNYNHVIHLCSEETSDRLAKKYDHHGSIISVTEYLQQPVYSKPPRGDGRIRLVYGGCMLATTDPEDLYYRAFTKVVPYFTRGNLELYVYNSPYVHGMVENDGLKEVIRRLGLTNIHACTPRKLDDFVREISDYDFGATLLRPRDMEAVEYNYFMATKLLTYLRAGLPVVIDADNHYMAGLVERYKLGVVLQDRDLENLPDILNSVDLPALKRNVIEAREQFSIGKGGEKVLRLYHEILQKTERRSRYSVPATSTASSELHTSHFSLHTSNDPAFQEMIDVMARRENRLYYRDQSARTMSSLAELARRLDPSVIVELGTLGGLSLRTWIASTTQTRIYAVDLSFQTLRETLQFLPADLSRVTLLEQDILKTDFARLWSGQDKVIFFVDAHDLPNVPIMKYVLETALPSLPDGSLVVVDDLWFSEERLTHANARDFLENRVCNEIDELQCFNGHYAPYHEGGSFLGFAEVIPLLEFVNRYSIPLVYDRTGKHVLFIWKKAYLSQNQGPAEGSGRSAGDYGSVLHNPLESVPVGGRNVELMRGVIARYRQRDIRGAAESLAQAIAQDPQDQGLSYGLAVCLARSGMLSQARDVLASNLSKASHPRYRRLFDDLVRRVGGPQANSVGKASQLSHAGGLTLFAMPKAFTGHTATIQKNAIRSWAALNPRPEIILFGDEPGIREIAEEVGATHVPDIGRNEFGTPLVDRLFQTAQELAAHDVLAYVNADMILMQDFVEGVKTTQTGLKDFLLIGRRWDLDVLDDIDFAGQGWRESLLRQVHESGMLHAECALDYFVFRKGLWPHIPPFAIGRTAWDNWLVLDPQERGIPVVDGSQTITAIHQDHSYGHLAGGRHEAWNGQEAKKNRALAGTIDDSAYTAGAAWALGADGGLAEAQPRQCEAGTPAYRGRRIAWLVKQAEWLMSREETELAACKWEETLTLLDKLTASRSPGHVPAALLDEARVTRCYVAACVSLAQCCAKQGRPEQAAAVYTRFLQAPWIEIPQARRDEMTRVRDQLLKELPQNTVSSGQSLTLPIVADNGPGPSKRIALIVSIPERREGLRSVIRDIEGQVDEIRVLLNEFETVPKDLYDFRKVSRVETSRTGELYASGVWNLLRPEDEGYTFILDDDITYPADYAERMIAKIEEHQRRAVMVVHGVDFCEPFEDCTRDRTIYRFEAACSRDGAVDAGGVGTLAFHTSTIRPQVQDFPNPNFRDLWFAVLAARNKVPIVCVARNAHWLRAQTMQARQLWYLFGGGQWKDLRNQVFRQNLLPLLDTRTQSGRSRRRDFSIFCITNGRSTFGYSMRSIGGSCDLQDRVQILEGMRFLDAANKCVELCETPYFFKVDDDFILHPQAIAYMRKKVLEYPRPQELGIYYCHLWEDWTSRVRESFKIYSVAALRKIGGFKADDLGKVDRTTLSRLQEAGFKIVADPSVVALHACGTWEEQLEYERLWSAEAGQSYQKPTHEAMKKYCGTKSLDEQNGMRLQFLEYVNEKLNTPFHQFLAGSCETRQPVAKDESVPPRVSQSMTRPEQACVAPSDVSAVTFDSGRASDCGLTIFAMPKAFAGHMATIQKNAIRNWAKLVPMPEIILFGNEPGIREMADEVGATHVPDVGRNEYGTPLVDRLFQAAQDLASHQVLAYVNADMILFDDFVQAVQKVQAQFPNFLLIGRRWDLPVLDEIDFSRPQWRESLLRQLQEHAMLHAECGLDYFVFREGLWPQIPPFAIGRTAWDNWLVMDPHRRNMPVVDGTAFITAVHQDHDYGHVSGGRHGAWHGMEAAKNRSLAGPADYSGLTTGSTWILREDGALVESAPRQPQYITAAYRDRRTNWLLRQARELIAVGAKELAACKCEELLACLDGWLELRRLGCTTSEPRSHVDIAGRCLAGHTLLAQCYMQMERYEQVVATYTRLLQNPSVQMSSTQRDSIVQVRDRLTRQIEGTSPSPDSPVASERRNVDARTAGPDASTASCPRPVIATGDAAGSRPKVTVVTSCRNAQRYLKECVDSILGQTMPDWELFLIDDGSTDDTRRMIEEYARQDARIRAHHFPDTRGPYVRRNFAIGRAASDFIVIQDADDIMSPTKIERLFREITQDNCLAIVGSHHRTFLYDYRGLEHTEPGDMPVGHDAIVASCVSWRAAISHGTAIIRKSLFDTIGLYDENPFAADAFWSAKLALYAQIGAPVRMANVPEYLTFIRIHPSSQTQILPVFDPRGRRVRYRHYCECKLRRVREKWRQQASLDVAAELRQCTCSDFLLRFKAKIIEWESETLPAHFLNSLLTGVLSSFREKAYVSCIIILNGLEVMQRDIARRVKGFDLVRGMALHASGLSEQASRHLQREIENHDNPLARKCLNDSCGQGDSMDVSGWCERNAPRLELRVSGEERERVRVAMT